jgi:hypothetical protein
LHASDRRSHWVSSLANLRPSSYETPGNILLIHRFCKGCKQIARDANRLQVKIHKSFVNKICDWTIRKRVQSSYSDYLIGLLFANSPIRGFVYKSFVNFNLRFVRVGCKLLRAICLPKLQYCGTILQCCLQENTRFDCNVPARNKITVA